MISESGVQASDLEYVRVSNLALEEGLWDPAKAVGTLS